MVATHNSDRNERKITDADTTNGNYPHKLILNWLIPKIITGTIRLIDQMIKDDVAGIGQHLEARQTVFSKEIVTDAARSGARIFRTSREVGRMGRENTASQDGNTVVAATRSSSQVQIGHSTTGSPRQNSHQEIINPIGPVSP